MWRTVIIAAAICFSTPALAWQELLPQARVIGEGQFRKFGFPIYDARLWAANNRLDGKQPFALQLHYRLSISRQQLVARSVDEIERIHPGALNDENRSRWMAWMKQAFVDVVAGDEIVGVYLPEQGARFYHRQQLTASIDDPEFARIFFDIWLSPKSLDKKLRSQLMGEPR